MNVFPKREHRRKENDSTFCLSMPYPMSLTEIEKDAVNLPLVPSYFSAYLYSFYISFLFFSVYPLFFSLFSSIERYQRQTHCFFFISSRKKPSCRALPCLVFVGQHHVAVAILLEKKFFFQRFFSLQGIKKVKVK